MRFPKIETQEVKQVSGRALKEKALLIPLLTFCLMDSGSQATLSKATGAGCVPADGSAVTHVAQLGDRCLVCV